MTLMSRDVRVVDLHASRYEPSQVDLATRSQIKFLADKTRSLLTGNILAGGVSILWGWPLS